MRDGRSDEKQHCESGEDDQRLRRVHPGQPPLSTNGQRRDERRRHQNEGEGGKEGQRDEGAQDEGQPQHFRHDHEDRRGFLDPRPVGHPQYVRQAEGPRPAHPTSQNQAEQDQSAGAPSEKRQPPPSIGGDERSLYKGGGASDGGGEVGGENQPEGELSVRKEVALLFPPFAGLG